MTASDWANSRVDEIACLLALGLVRARGRELARIRGNSGTFGEVSTGLPACSERASGGETHPGEAG